MDSVVVLGFPRSGTSALTGALAAMGWSTGGEDQLLKADLSNPRGYFERRDVLEANDDLLVSIVKQRLPIIDDYVPGAINSELFGYAWVFGAWVTPWDPVPPSQRSLRIDAVAQAFKSAVQGSKAFVLKDARLCLTLEHWRAQLPSFKPIVILRHPGSVARSLYKRNGVPPALTYSLWLLYLDAVFRQAPDSVTRSLFYEDLVREPRGMLTRLLAGLNTEASTENLNRGSNFIERELAHHRAEENEAPAVLDSLYRDLRSRRDGVRAEIAALAEREQEFATWGTGLFMLEQSAKIYYRGVLDRVNKHPIAGPFLRAMRRLKKDESFGKA